jgi:uncharacterized LabA/DUF88 family protein
MKNNIAFIDGQNLRLGTTKCDDCSHTKKISFKKMAFSDCTCGKAWKVNMFNLREYLRKKYSIQEAYYFLGFLNEDLHELYTELQKAGYVIIFRQHNQRMSGNKKGNVDTDIVFEIMRNVIDNKQFEKILLISGDGDYKKTVDYLISKERFERILFPNGKKYSSLYDSINNKFTLSIDRPTVRKFLEYSRNEKGASPK